ncbi:DUF484 family protein [Methylophaga thalassica]|uniref:DUF484 domain-containing protein n=1 Tax=Methylophaga aminisulfidivorans MP TaxID=1026882 RepID=F5SZB0_9GAMM|nr:MULTISPECIES: DUF484 family protein [Methylophaga]EGL54633.1 protein of unknown function DUF484 [Methylophaga aminisulfidivorans MP]WVI85802.1 DUF484 family protein [Methylophaga thalassica]
MVDTTTDLTLEQIEQYLEAHPDLFLEQPHLLESLNLNSSPEGTISLAQRQTQRLQEKNQQLNEQLHALIDNAHSNAALEKRVHNLCLSVMDAVDLADLINLIQTELKQEFAADDVALRLFYQGQHKLDLPQVAANVSQLHADDKKLRIFDNLFTKQEPVCGRLTKAQKGLLFDERAEAINSVACLPLGHQPCAGLLAIGSVDANRFHADMATDYLSFLGEVVMRVIRQHTHQQHAQ